MHFVALITFLMILMIETVYREPWWQSSLIFIPKIQAGASSFGSTVWDLYSNLGVTSGIGLPPVILMVFKWRRLHSLYYVIMLTSMLFLMNITKLWYHGPRPFWVSLDIYPYTCNTQYGNPSGHSMFSMAAALTVWLDFNQHYRNKTDSRLQPLWVRSVAFVVAVTYSFTIGYSRIFLGAHSWNELAFGWQLGVWLAFTIFFCYKDSMFYRLEQFNKGMDDKV